MRIAILALFACMFVACKKSSQGPPPQPPPVEEIKDCRPVRVSSSDGAGGYIQTEFFYNTRKQPDSSKNPYYFTKFYYQDTLLVKREVLFTNTTQIRNYDSLFYNTNGSLQKIKMFNVDDFTLIGVRDIVLSYTYTGNKLTKVVATESASGNFLRESQYEFTYDAKDNVSNTRITSSNGDVVNGKYYYSDESNPFPRIKVPIGYFLHGAGLNRPGLLLYYLPFFISSKKVNKLDDTSGNMGIPIEIIGTTTGIIIRENNFTSYNIATACP